MLTAGVDIIEIRRVEEALARWGERFLHRIYTGREIAFCRGRSPELAARFAAKEAISKALGTGMRGVAWREMEILPDGKGKPLLRLYGRARQRAEAIGLDEFALSLSHSHSLAIAFVVAHKQQQETRRAGN
ncbi:MAG: holo-ACP synthase [Chloroflexi bacterium]|nr:holo-ACP synthase [Chloroflexota bacterium]